MPIQTEMLTVPVLGHLHHRDCSSIGPVATFLLPGKPARWPILHCATGTTLCVAASEEQALAALAYLDRQPIDWENIDQLVTIEGVLAEALFELERAAIVCWRGWKRSKWYPVATGAEIIYAAPQDRRAGCWHERYTHGHIEAVRGADLLQQVHYARYVVRQPSDMPVLSQNHPEIAINRLLEDEAIVVMLARSEQRTSARDERCRFWFEWRAVVLSTERARNALMGLYPFEEALHPLRGADHPILLQRRRCDTYDPGYKPPYDVTSDPMWNAWRNQGVAATAWEAVYGFTGSDFLRATSLHPLQTAVVAIYGRCCQLREERTILSQPMNGSAYEVRAEALIRQAGPAVWRAFQRGTLDQAQLQQLIAPIKAEYEAAKADRVVRLQAIDEEIARLVAGIGTPALLPISTIPTDEEGTPTCTL